jgi:hypothetical protein
MPKENANKRKQPISKSNSDAKLPDEEDDDRRDDRGGDESSEYELSEEGKSCS